MLSLLDPRIWIAFALACAISGGIGFYKGQNYGKSAIKAEWSASVAAANKEAAQISERRSSAVGKARDAAATRATGHRVDAARAGDALQRLRDTINARDLAEQSIASANQRADTYAELFLESAGALREMAETCDRIVNDRQMLLDAWPK